MLDSNTKKNKGIKVLSCFDGISCARVALDRAGIIVDEYYASEIDKYAMQVALKNYSDTIQIGNIVDFHPTPLICNHIDLMIGGSPCQDLSIAKKDRKGLDGERSGLFWEYVRLLKEVKPKYFILENVNSMPKEAKQIITDTLGVEPIMINAALVSAQNRKRLFWTNIPNVTQPEDRDILLRDILEENVDERYFINIKTQYKIENEWGKKQGMGQAGRIRDINGKSVTLQSGGGGTGAKTGLYAVALRNRGQSKKPGLGGDKANSMTTVQTDSMIIEDTQIRKLTPIECERLQGLPDGYTDGVSNSQRYKMLGNAFNVDVVAHILSFIPKDNE